MAWTAPPTWSVGQVVTAAQMQILSDDLNYLKGTSGAIQLDNTVTIQTASAPRLYLTTTSGANKRSSIDFRQSATDLFQIGVDLSSNNTRDLYIYDYVAAAVRMVLDSGGNLGIGTGTPAGRLHVGAAGAVSGAGFAINSVAAVTSIQTIFAAGTVARGGMFLIVDRNNTGGGINSLTNINALAVLGGNFTYTNNDTMTVSVTAGGAVTVARTTGTNGTHDVVMLAIFL